MVSPTDISQHLLLSHSFTLNKSYTKQVCVGLKVGDNFAPVVQLYGVQHYKTIKFRAGEWKEFSNHLEHILSYFDDAKEPEEYQPIHCGDVSVCYSTSSNLKCVIFRRKNGCEFYVPGITLEELRKKSTWIDHLLQFLHQLPIMSYVNSIADSTAVFMQKNLMRNSLVIPDYRIIETYVKNNFADVYNFCEKTVLYSGPSREFQCLYMFFGEMINFYFDDLYKLIIKALSTHRLDNNVPSFYGEDTIF